MNSACVLFTINRWEPFGSAAVAAQAGGAQFIATCSGVLPEIILHGETGFVVDSADDAVSTAGRLSDIRSDACRKNVEDRFTSKAVTRGFSRVYDTFCRLFI